MLKLTYGWFQIKNLKTIFGQKKQTKKTIKKGRVKTAAKSVWGRFCSTLFKNLVYLYYFVSTSIFIQMTVVRRNISNRFVLNFKMLEISLYYFTSVYIIFVNVCSF